MSLKFPSMNKHGCQNKGILTEQSDGDYMSDAFPVGKNERHNAMGNNHYRQGRQKEYELKARLEHDGYMVFRTAGSHSPADLVAVRPNKAVGEADLFPEVRFIQVKSSQDIAEERREIQFINHLQVEFFYLPIHTKKWYAKRTIKCRRSKKTRTQGQ